MPELITKTYNDGTVIQMYEHIVHERSFYADVDGQPAIRHMKDGRVVFERHQSIIAGGSAWDTSVKLHCSSGPAIVFYNPDGTYSDESAYHIHGNSIGTYGTLRESKLLDDNGNFTADFAFTIDMCGDNYELVRKYVASLSE